MTISVLTAANKGYQSGNPTVPLTVTAPAKGVVSIVCGSSFLAPEDAAWAPSITDGTRTWTLRARNQTNFGTIWVFDWYNSSASSASISFTINFPAGTNNMSTGWCVLGIPDVADPDAAGMTPTIVKNPLGDTISTASAAIETATIIVGHRDETILAFASGGTTLPTADANTTLSTSAPVSVVAHSGEGSYGVMWRTNTGPAAGVPVVVGTTAPTNALAACIAVSYKALPLTGSPTDSTGTAPLGWFSPMARISSWFDGMSRLKGWFDEDNLVADTTINVSGTVAATSGVTGSISVNPALSGSVAATSGSSGTVAALDALSGTVAAVSGVSDSATAIHPVAGQVDAVSGVTGSGNSQQAVAGQADGVSGASGDVLTQRAVAGQVDGVTAVSGTATAIVGLSGQVDAPTSVSGSINVIGGAVQHAVSGTVAAVSGTSGALGALLSAAAGQVDGTSTTSGDPTALHPLAGQVDGVSGTSGSVTGRAPAAGTVTAASAVAGTVGAIRAVSGQVDAVSGASGLVLGSFTLQAVAAAASDTTGLITLLTPVSGQADAVSGTSGVLGLPVDVVVLSIRDGSGFTVTTVEVPRAVTTTERTPATSTSEAPRRLTMTETGDRHVSASERG